MKEAKKLGFHLGVYDGLQEKSAVDIPEQVGRGAVYVIRKLLGPAAARAMREPEVVYKNPKLARELVRALRRKRIRNIGKSTLAGAGGATLGSLLFSQEE